MKRSTLLGSAVLASLALAPCAKSQVIASTVYDLETAWNNEGILELFKTAYEQGRNYPTKQEFEKKGTGMDLEFVRSHTRYRAVDKNSDKDVVQDAGFNHDRLLWCNLPGGYGKVYGGYPQAEFDQDVFSMWNYTSLFGAWNYGFLQAPGSWVDAAHKNGTRIYGGIKFFESWGDNGNTFAQFIQTKASSGEYTYQYSRAFVNAAAFFGNDGYNYNQEGTNWRTADWRDFHAEVRQIARDLGIEGFGIGQYTNQSSVSATYGQYMYGTGGKVTFDCMLNYSNNQLAYSGVSTSLNYAAAQELSLDNLFQGQLLVGLSNDYWTQMNTTSGSIDRRKMNIAIWGEHDQSRFFQFRVGNSPTNIQENYQLLLEKAFSGANRNPLSRPAINNAWGSFQVASADQADEQLKNSPGFASMIPERTAIIGKLPFETHFSLGNGENYFYKGKVTHGAWYNMSQQDIVPTYRWLVTAKDNMKSYASDIDVRFTHEDAYIGGSSLKLSGATSAGNDVVLYRTKLTVTEGTPKVDIALKLFGADGPAAGDSHLSVILKKENSDSWIVVPCQALQSGAWETQNLEVSGLATDDVIEYIGLRVEGTDQNYKMLVGHLKVSDDRQVQQAVIRDGSLTVEVKEENAKSLSVKMNWEPNYDSYETSIDQYGMVYNDEVHIDHFEIFYKDTQDGTPKEIGRTAQWATYIGAIPMDQSTTDAWIGVRSVSEDLHCMSPVQWVQIPRSDYQFPQEEEEDPYGRSWMSTSGAGSEAQVIRDIWTKSVVSTGAVQNINYDAGSSNPTASAGDQYCFAKDNKLIVKQGQTVNITFTGYESGTGECSEYHVLYAYMDYDGNYSFLDNDEVLGSVGALNAGSKTITSGWNLTFTVPNDAHIGESRLRFVGSNAWVAHPGPTGNTVSGYTIDFPVEIQGDNVQGQRGPAKTYKDYRDAGEAEAPENFDTEVTGIDGIVAEQGAAFSSVVLNGDVASFANTDKAWIYDLSGRVVRFVPDATQEVSVANLADGVYVVKMQNGQIIRSTKVVKK